MNQLLIAGGLYGESCIDPPWNELFGPGGRAAAALSNRGIDIELYCYFEAQQAYRADFQAGNFGFRLIRSDGPTLTFNYFHFLSVPEIRPALKFPAPTIEIIGDRIVRYGFLEGDARVIGKQVVYDPQNAGAPVSFWANGSSAERLAVVCNLGEARSLTGKSSAEECALALLEIERAEVVVLKMGGAGALVQTSSGVSRVPAHMTETVRKIGSGDVFTAEFAYRWIIQGADPVTAAKGASLQTAFYCEYQTLPLRPHVVEQDLPAVTAPPLRTDKTYDVYLAGPFFNLGQRWLIEEVRNLFREMELRVFSPIHDVGEGAAEAVAEADLRGLDESRFVFACLDAFDPGTVFEIGYAHAHNIPVLAYGQNLSEHDKVMFEGSGCILIPDFVSAIYRALFWKLHSPKLV